MKDAFTGRKHIITTLMVLVSAGLLVKLFSIQVVNDSYRLSADNNVLRYVTQYPARGLIYDRNGKLIVFNQAAYDLMVVPAQTSGIDTSMFCELLGISSDLFNKQMKTAINYSRRAPSVFLKQISDITYARLQEKLFLFPGFYVQPRTLRKYTKAVASHILGYVSEADDGVIRKDPYYKPGDYIGKLGIEEEYEKDLRGKRGVKIYLVDVFSRLKGSYADGKMDTLAVQGSDITSSIDLDLQQYGESLMKNKKGSIVVIQPKTGEVLTLVSAPEFDPSLLVGRVRSENFSKLHSDTVRQPLFNRALMASYPPGSTFKPVMGLIGLQEGVITPQTLFECHMGYLSLGCHSHDSPLSLTGAISTSCNSYFAQTYRRVLENKQYETITEAYNKWKTYLNEFGFGTKLESDFVNELPGFVPSSDYFNNYYRKNKWKALNIISMGIGQGELGTTPLQMANMTAVIANRGYFYPPHIVKFIGADHHIDKRLITRHRVDIDSLNFERIVLGMQSVVNTGTGRVAATKDIIICGKTGTVQNAGKDHSVFVAFAPKDNPEIAIAVYIENAGAGAEYAAPVARLMIEKYINGCISDLSLENRILDLNLQ